MKKAILLFLFHCFVITLAYGQQTRDSIVTRQRLIRCTYKSYQADSSLTYTIVLDYRYSGNRGSRFRITPAANTFGYNYVRFPTLEPQQPLAHMPAPYGDVYKTDVDYDVVYDRQHGGTDSFLMTKYRRYEGERQIVHTDSNGDGYFTDRMTRWSGDGKITGIDFYSRRDTNTPSLYQTIKTAYDTVGISTDSIYKPMDVNNYLNVRNYRYDENGRLSSIEFLRQRGPNTSISLTDKYEYEYDAGGNLYKNIRWVADGTGQLDTSGIHTISYNAEGQMTSYLMESYLSTYSRLEYTYHYNEAGDMDTFAYWHLGNKSHFTYFIYNDAHNPVFSWQSNVGVNGMPTGRWYTQDFVYENYYDTFKIPVPEITDPIMLYPNPAGSSFTIRWNKDNPKRAVNIALYNPMGQSIRKYHIATPQGEDKLDISGIASGMYYVEIITTTGGKIYRGSLAVQGW